MSKNPGSLPFKEVANSFEKIERVSSRLEMVSILERLFAKVGKNDISKLVYIIQGRILPEYEGVEIGLGINLVLETLAKITGYTRKEIEKYLKSSGDIGETAEHFTQKKKQKTFFTETLTIENTYKTFYKIATVEGKGAVSQKVNLLAQLLNSSSPKEAKHIVRFVVGKSRLGISTASVIESLALYFADAFLKEKNSRKKLEEKFGRLKKEEERQRARMFLKEKIEEKYFIHSDLGDIAEKLWEKGMVGLKDIKVEVFTPVKPALAERLRNAEEIFKKLGSCLIETKYDGFRLQIHRKNERVRLYSRRQEDITHMLPDVVENVKRIKKSKFIIEAEALAYNKKTKEPLPFQQTIQRKRKYNIKEMVEKLPLRLFVFDVLLLDDKEILWKKFEERRKLVEKHCNLDFTLMPSEAIFAEKASDIARFFKGSLKGGREGIIAKELNMPYTPGVRKFAWIKLKKSYQTALQDTVDVVIIGAYRGTGKRSHVLGSFLTAIYNEEEDKFETIAKVSTGFSDSQLEEFNKKLQDIKTTKKDLRYVVSKELSPDIYVEPSIVIEVTADEITKSPNHTAAKTLLREDKGLALRFPRFLRLRDKKPEDATTNKEILEMFNLQGDKK